MKVKQDRLEQYDYPDGEYLDKVRRRYVAPIGKFLIGFSSLEHSLDIHIAESFIDDAHEYGYLIIEGSSLCNKIDLFRKLFQMRLRYMKPRHLVKLAAILKRLHAARVFRNYIAHANWVSLEKSGYVRTKIDEKDGEVVLKKVRITPIIIGSWIKRVERLENDLYEFVEKCGEIRD